MGDGDGYGQTHDNFGNAGPAMEEIVIDNLK